MLINKFLNSQEVVTDVRKGFYKFQKSRDSEGQGTRIFRVQQDSFERKFAVINASITNKQTNNTNNKTQEDLKSTT